VARDRGSRVFFFNMLKRDGREFFFFFFFLKWLSGFFFFLQVHKGGVRVGLIN
jgi:hypothetical protein